jgi:hypothetical protein
MKMKNLFASTKLLFAPLVMSCAVATLTGCASTDRRASASSFEEQNLPRAEAPASLALPQHAVLDERAFQKLDLNGDGAITLDEWKHFDASASAKEHFNALDENGDGQISLMEFLTQAPKHSERYHFFGDTDKTDGSFVSPDKDVFQNPGWHLFSFHF